MKPKIQTTAPDFRKNAKKCPPAPPGCGHPAHGRPDGRGRPGLTRNAKFIRRGGIYPARGCSRRRRVRRDEGIPPYGCPDGRGHLVWLGVRHGLQGRGTPLPRTFASPQGPRDDASIVPYIGLWCHRDRGFRLAAPAVGRRGGLPIRPLALRHAPLPIITPKTPNRAGRAPSRRGKRLSILLSWRFVPPLLPRPGPAGRQASLRRPAARPSARRARPRCA